MAVISGQPRLETQAALEEKPGPVAAITRRPISVIPIARQRGILLGGRADEVVVSKTALFTVMSVHSGESAAELHLWDARAREPRGLRWRFEPTGASFSSR